MKQKLLPQIFLCIFALIVCSFLFFRVKTRTFPAGTFGSHASFNETLEDFAVAVYGDFFNE